MQRVKVLKDKGSKRLGEAFPLSHVVQSKPPCFLNSWWRLGAAEPKLDLRLGRWFIAIGFVSAWSLTNLTFTKWSNRVTCKHSTNLTIDLGWQYSYYTCYRVFKPIHTLTQTDMKKFVQRCLLKISLKFSTMLKSNTSASQKHQVRCFCTPTGEGWALRSSQDILGPTINEHLATSIEYCKLESLLALRGAPVRGRLLLTAHCSPGDLKGPHSGLLLLESQDDWLQSPVNLHPGCNLRW